MQTSETIIGRYAPDFELPGITGEVHHLRTYLERYSAIGVVFMANRCPKVRQYLDRLKQIQSEFSHRNFTLVGINPNDGDGDPEESFEKMREFKTEFDLNFPYVRDVTQDVAKGFNVEVTPQAFLIDKSGRVCYGGAIDDNADDPNGVQQAYFKDAIVRLLENGDVDPFSTEAIGCAVQWKEEK